MASFSARNSTSAESILACWCSNQTAHLLKIHLFVRTSKPLLSYYPVRNSRARKMRGQGERDSDTWRLRGPAMASFVLWRRSGSILRNVLKSTKNKVIKFYRFVEYTFVAM